MHFLFCGWFSSPSFFFQPLVAVIHTSHARAGPKYHNSLNTSSHTSSIYRTQRSGLNTAHPKTQRQLCFLADVVQERGLNAVSFRFSQQQQEKQNITLMSHFISQLAPDERGSAEQGVAAPPCLLWRGSAFNLFTRLLIFRDVCG